MEYDGHHRGAKVLMDFMRSTWRILPHTSRCCNSCRGVPEFKTSLSRRCITPFRGSMF